ncbi:YebC/PmpR family DNA-binding transcriptional regulator [Clostridium tyrobutyricum]|uniref:YebC/PmpR family DNA-binding transcriptional regulator n=1 Tax=Clostridium tyrobutyricum TaxID=1519 RepID=UPI001C387D4E|nr:YebC/PmpR family DNA-binding transcriptional regulator [Clostridium tyrobutyricum]MBV4418291.1 YebC/PmpR family DNA-binding transcriptional regulator [Clostridium tyrobutyricum]
MSGHSKWHNIQAKKGKIDAQRGKIFTKIGKEIAIAAKDGSNPDTNSKLRDVIAKAKSNNMPQDTINRAIKKGSGEMEGLNYEEVTYEGYGPSGVAIIVKALTDNKNRTAGNVRTAFTRSGGNLGANGCVGYMFQTKGQIIIEKTDDMDEDDMMMKVLDAGAEDFETQDEVFEITTTIEEFGNVRDSLESQGFKFISADIIMIPDTLTAVDMETAEKVQKLIDKLEDDDDVQNVYHNADFPDEFDD